MDTKTIIETIAWVQAELHGVETMDAVSKLDAIRRVQEILAYLDFDTKE